MSTRNLFDKGVVEESEILFTTGGPVTTVKYKSQMLGGGRALQVNKEIVLLKDDEIEIYAPPGIVSKPLRLLPTFQLVRSHVYETYGIDVERVTLEEVKELRVVAFFVLILNYPSIRPNAIHDMTWEITYDEL